MKKLGLLVGLLLFVGCGSSDNSRPAQDGKGEIDIKSYLAKESSTKFFSGSTYGAAFVGLSAKSTVTVEENEIIEDTVYESVFRGYPSTGVSKKFTIYNDFNITTKFSLNNSPYRIETFYRYVNDNEIKNESNEEKIENIVNYAYDLVIGKEIHDISNRCIYHKVNKIVLFNEVMHEGDFLTIECITKDSITYLIDKEYFTLDETYESKNGKKEIKTSKTIEYYKKEIGYFGYITYYDDGQTISFRLLK
jgi:hypothetical protein